MKGFVVVPEQVLDGEPRDADGLDEGELGVVDGLALGVGVGGWPAVLHRGERVQRHPHRGDHHEGDRYHRDHLRREDREERRLQTLRTSIEKQQ